MAKKPIQDHTEPEVTPEEVPDGLQEEKTEEPEVTSTLPSDEELREQGHLPTLFYRCPGTHARFGGTYDYLPINSVADAQRAIDSGWLPTLPEAIEAYDKG